MTNTYTVSAFGGVLRDADSAYIPNDLRNADWQAYQLWLAAGNTPNPYVAPPAPPITCALWQLQSVMTAAQWSSVQSFISSMNEPTVSAFFDHGTNQIPSDSKTLLQIGEGIGLTQQQIVDLVTQAAAISIP
jgi:hypothetical protein